MEDMVKHMISHSLGRDYGFVPEVGKIWHPPTDVYETRRDVVIRMELPGIDPRDVRISLDGQRLIVCGRRRDASRAEKLSYHCLEIHYGSFRRSIFLHTPVQAAGAAASFKNGILDILLPLGGKSSDERRVIEIA